jgi:hypothetical protein
MASFDVFKGDGFTLSQLTLGINTGPHVPTLIGDSNLFSEEGVTTTTVQIEKQGSKLVLVPSQERGGNAIVVNGEKRKLIPFNTVHLPQRATILADEIQGKRAFGSETEAEMMEAFVNKRFMKLRKNLEVTLEYHRIGAIQGKVLDADGATVLVDLYAKFGLTQQTKSLALSTATTKVRNKLIEAKEMLEESLGAEMYSGLICYCSSTFFKALISHANVEKAYERWQDGAMLRNDPRAGFVFGDITFKVYRGKVNGVDFIPEGKAYLVPEGIQDMFVTNFAPADYMETVNTDGLPFYANQELLPMNKGVALEAQSNPLCINTRPDCVIELS